MGLATIDPHLKVQTKLYKIPKFGVNRSKSKQGTAIRKCLNLQRNECMAIKTVRLKHTSSVKTWLVEHFVQCVMRSRHERFSLPNTVSARFLADAIQRAHKDCWDHFICSMPSPSVLFFFIIEHSVLVVLVFYYKFCKLC